MTSHISSGAWQTAEHMSDYRSERFSDMFVERVTWSATVPTQTVNGISTIAPGHIWFRFWLFEGQQIVEKYFDAGRQPMAMYAPVTTPFALEDGTLTARNLLLALWLDMDGRITVLNEHDFEAAVVQQLITAAESEHAEHRIRELTREAGQGFFPPAMVRNFHLKSPAES